MKRLSGLLVVCMLCSAAVAVGQELIPSPGKVVVMQDEQMARLAEQYRKLNIQNQSADGYRVQIFFESGTNSKNKAISARDAFQLAYPGVKAYLSYKAPNYRVRVGNFHSLVEAAGFQKQIMDLYPNAFAVKDKIYY